jgi:N-glycosylase/DNA lyase
MNITKPKNFSFKNTIYSHGWSELKPFEIDEQNWRLSYVFDGKDFQKPFSAIISATAQKIKIELSDKNITVNEKIRIKQTVRHILRIDEEFDEFYEIARKDKNFIWMAENNIGRLLRSQTVFEDLIKTICTTNCSWGLTKNMVTNLVEKLGSQNNEGKKSFPTAEVLATKDEKFYREDIRAGYRAPYFAELAEAVTGGKVNPETWLQMNLPTSELKKEMKQIKGVGDYAAENLLKLVGRYDGLALDSFLRSGFYKKHNNGVNCPDSEIKEFYAKFGKFRGLAIWFDMTKRWFD